MFQQNTTYDTSKELCIAHYRRGVKLLRPNNKNAKHTVADLLALPFNTYFLAPDSTILNANEGTAATQAFSSIKDAIGKSVRDALQPEFAAPIIHEDQSVIKTASLIIAENQGKRMDDIELQCLTFKFPWYSEHNELIGIIGFSIMMKTFAVLSVAESLSKIINTGLLGLPEATQNSSPSLFSRMQLNGVYLSKRETDIAKWLVRGKTASAIAKQIGRSKRTVEHQIENIKLKTGCTSKYELIELIVDAFNALC